MKYLLTFLLLNNLHASEILTFDEIKFLQASPQKVDRNGNRRQGGARVKNLKRELNETKKKLDAYRYMAKMQIKTPLIFKKMIIGEGQFIGASTMLEVMATNSPTTILLDNLKGIDLPDGAKISCKVITKFKRVCGHCTRLIVNGVGMNIDANLKNKDGSNCAIGRLTDGKEKFLTGILVSEMAKGALAVSQTSIPTIQGSVIKDTARNKITQGLINTAETTTELLADEYKTSEPIVMISKGVSVIVQFNKKVSI